ncbi:MAG: chitobiase/beta-hexosaminidase C-terminal domain-containing protein, partial [Pseudanabaenales cyanobacterium]|nr:chitobiase/beta-hexosaminidase C-terminal domain-containing protein [Pseudanabaenales cyanobacterium]
RRSAVVVSQLWSHGLAPDIEPPALNQHGGAIDRGFALVMTAKQGEIRFTLEGSDPRLRGGEPSPTSRVYQGPVELTRSTTVKSRAFTNGKWSVLTEAKFEMD